MKLLKALKWLIPFRVYKVIPYVKPPCVHHQWGKTGTTPHFWKYVDGKACGMMFGIESSLRNRPKHPQEGLLKSWLAQGHDHFHISMEHWKCSNCGETGVSELPCEPCVHLSEDGERMIKKVVDMVT